MNTINVENCKTLLIGRRGENEVTTVAFDFTEWASEFGSGVVDLYVKRFGDDSAYPVLLTIDGTVASWLVTETDTNVAGYGKAEYVYRVDGKIAKSAVFPFFVAEDIGQPASEAPDPYESWLEQLTALGAETEAHAQAAEQSAENAAQSAEDAAQSAASAEDYAGQAETAAVLAQAAQTASEAARDDAQTAQESAESSATAASDSAASAASSATAAAGSASDASSSASAAGASATTASNAATAAQTAQSAAEDAAEDAQQAAQQAHVEYEQLAEEVTDQKSAIDNLTALTNRKAGMLVDSASGAIASFVPDSTIPDLLGVSVAVEPVQDLHGYDSPWPAGGGKNLLPMLINDIKSANTSGAWTGNTYTYNGVTFAFSVNDGGAVTAIAVSGTATTGTDIIIINQTGSLPNWITVGTTYTVSGNATLAQLQIIPRIGSTYQNTRTNTSFSWDSSWDGVYIRIRVDSGHTASGTLYPMVESGSAPTTYAPYSNECPISGWGSVEVETAGANLFDKSRVTPNTWIEANGTGLVAQNGYSVSDFIPIKKGHTYYMPSKSTGRNAYYDKNKVGIAYQAYSGGTSLVASYDGYIRVSLANGVLDSFGVVEGTASDFKPYAGNRYTIQLGQTVYGGTLDVTNGTLSVGYKKIVLGASGGTDVSSSQSVRLSYPLPSDSITSGGALTGELFSNFFAETDNSSSYYGAIGCLYRANGAHEVVLSFGTMFATVSEARVWVAENKPEILYKLATPIVIQLDPVQISTIGNQTNNVWADAGDVDVEYAADLKHYIDSKIAAAVAALS